MRYSTPSVFMVFMLCCLAVLSGIVKYVGVIFRDAQLIKRSNYGVHAHFISRDGNV